jgi:hypothetical protein
MDIRITQDMPIDPSFGATEGKIFKVDRLDRDKDMVYFTGENNRQVAAFLSEVELIGEEETAPAPKKGPKKTLNPHANPDGVVSPPGDAGEDEEEEDPEPESGGSISLSEDEDEEGQEESQEGGISLSEDEEAQSPNDPEKEETPDPPKPEPKPKPAAKKEAEPKTENPVSEKSILENQATEMDWAEYLDIPVHELASLPPMLGEDRMQELSDSIKKQGLIDDIVFLEGELLDGRNRWVACKLAGVEPRTREFDPEAEGSPVDFVAAKNNRRDLTPSQRAAYAAELLPFYEEESKKRQATKGKSWVPPIGGTQGKGKKSPKKAAKTAAKQAAKATGSSERSVQRAKQLKKNDPKGFEEVKKGKKSLNAASTAASKQEEREKGIQRIKNVCGRDMAQAVEDGVRLKTHAELKKFLELSDDDMKRCAPLVKQGWKVSKAINYKMVSICRTHKISDLLDRAIAKGGKLELQIEGFKITVEKE